MRSAKRRFALAAAGILCASILLPCASCWFNPLYVVEHGQVYEKTYTLKELQQIEAASFRSLNRVEYPDSSVRTTYPVSETYRNAMYDFALNVYRRQADTTDFSFSPLGLYTNLSLLALASDNEAALAALDGVLGMDKATRQTDFVNMYKSNFFCNKSGTLQQYNASFQHNRWESNAAYTADLAAHYTEAYSMDFFSDEDVAKMLAWVDAKTGEKGFLSKKDLDLQPDSSLLLFSTLFFDNRWRTSYSDADSYTGTFYGTDGENKATFMNHSYSGDCYDYGEYIACYDYYQNGMKIKYFTPKKSDGDIFSLTSGRDLLRDDESCRIRSAEEEDRSDAPITVHLSLPKFEKSCMTDFSDSLKEMGLGGLFERESHAFDYAFSSLPSDVSSYLSFVKQKNKIAFSEDGTVIRSVSVSGVGMDTSAPPMKSISLRLDHPFIYVVFDANDLPLYIGNVDQV